LPVAAPPTEKRTCVVSSSPDASSGTACAAISDWSKMPGPPLKRILQDGACGAVGTGLSPFPSLITTRE
jgi:hypothetical protein